MSDPLLFVDTSESNVTVTGNLHVTDVTVTGDLHVTDLITLNGNAVLDTYDKNPVSSVHGIIGREPLYTWQGDQPFSNAVGCKERTVQL